MKSILFLFVLVAPLLVHAKGPLEDLKFADGQWLCKVKHWKSRYDYSTKKDRSDTFYYSRKIFIKFNSSFSAMKMGIAKKGRLQSRFREMEPYEYRFNPKNKKNIYQKRWVKKTKSWTEPYCHNVTVSESGKVLGNKCKKHSFQMSVREQFIRTGQDTMKYILTRYSGPKEKANKLVTNTCKLTARNEQPAKPKRRAR
ncbi:MAG: hypothetical protein HN509_06390 [Halobacteriovoraceae bacterium]|jgi:hypothetical protein|nr:hypothetical protein [Halobacteriovoraceae bacterium]MBT5095459.1 hypothetical protein [Halobacteriovoraceae bacterium]